MLRQLLAAASCFSLAACGADAVDERNAAGEPVQGLEVKQLGSHAQRLGTSDTFLGVSVNKDDVSVYLCDGTDDHVTISKWYRGKFKDGAFDVVDGDTQLHLTRDGDLLQGTAAGIATVGQTVALQMVADDGTNGMYQMDDDGDVTTWILVDGEVRGAERRATGVVRTAPPTNVTNGWGVVCNSTSGAGYSTVYTHTGSLDDACAWADANCTNGARITRDPR